MPFQELIKNVPDVGSDKDAKDSAKNKEHRVRRDEGKNYNSRMNEL